MSNKYTVKQGDTYWGISKKLYGTGTAFSQILSAKMNGNIIPEVVVTALNL